MSTKTITIMNDAYLALLRNKLKNESFSEAIRRILSKKSNIMEFAGSWSNLSDKEIEDMKKRIEENDITETKKVLTKYKK